MILRISLEGVLWISVEDIKLNYMESVWLEESLWTPAQKSHHSGSSSCQRNFGSQEANLYHLFWACPKVHAFWRKIYTELVTEFGTETIFKRDEPLFGLHSTSINIKTKTLIKCCC